jgi:hypothetical protein
MKESSQLEQALRFTILLLICIFLVTGIAYILSELASTKPLFITTGLSLFATAISIFIAWKMMSLNFVRDDCYVFVDDGFTDEGYNEFKLKNAGPNLSIIKSVTLKLGSIKAPHDDARLIEKLIRAFTFDSSVYDCVYHNFDLPRPLSVDEAITFFEFKPTNTAKVPLGRIKKIRELLSHMSVEVVYENIHGVKKEISYCLIPNHISDLEDV